MIIIINNNDMMIIIKYNNLLGATLASTSATNYGNFFFY